MRKAAFVSSMIVLALSLSVGLRAADKPKLICPVSGKEAKMDHAEAYKGGKVYFCCGNCPGEFTANTEKYATKANAQLVASKQYREKVCPLTGKKLNTATVTEVGGVKVCFCCNNCKGKVDKAEGDAKLALVFGDKAFEKGFVKAQAGGKGKKAKKEQ